MDRPTDHTSPCHASHIIAVGEKPPLFYLFLKLTAYLYLGIYVPCVIYQLVACKATIYANPPCLFLKQDLHMVRLELGVLV